MRSIIERFHRSSDRRSPNVRVTKTDIFSRLPFELHVLVLGHLEPIDVVAATSASRVLRLIWISDEMWPALADRWYPGLSDCIRSTATDGQNMGETFRQALHRIIRRTDGKFVSALHLKMRLGSNDFFQLSQDVPVSEGGVHSYDSIEGLEFHPKQSVIRFMMYNNGRIAWWPEAYNLAFFAVVDDFRTRKRRAYMFPNHGVEERGYKTAMSDKLLIMSRRTTLHAWHLELDHLQSVEVPGLIERCVTEGETALIVLKNSEAFLWEFGRELQHIDIDKFSCYTKSPVSMGGMDNLTLSQWARSRHGLYLRQSQTLVDFIVHPRINQAYFVITLTHDGQGQLTVYEIHAGELIGTYIAEDRAFSGSNISEQGPLRWEKANSYGGYLLTQAIMGRPDPDEADLASCTVCQCGRSRDELVSMCFNIYTKSFTTFFHHLTEYCSMGCMLWNGQLAVCGEETVTWLTPCIGKQRPRIRPGGDIPSFTTTSGNTSPILRRRQIPSNYQVLNYEVDAVDYVLDTSQPIGSTADEPESRWIPPHGWTLHQVVGDDNFLVFVDKQRYAVWSFWGEIPAKPLAAGNERRSRWQKN
ncbi:Uu.00g140160.m01.CDS01 [Anthostomella pinea]|uniref:Uu.00g140160.m01.CDS01 n=1 Tax=Anthostomella pinea TaxID=933095 RepID=A0AAI8YLH4_9PEZI|nr:Uu.00g140160.m01.CDS01 [Anthostomella pinea]